MPYDADISSETVTIDTKRLVSRITFYRSDSCISSEAVVDEYRFIGDEVISSDTFLIKIDSCDFSQIEGYDSFLSSYISLINDIKNENDASGSSIIGTVFEGSSFNSTPFTGSSITGSLFPL